ncbi:MAG TPA: substrate-binding domain-containing protein, partial [Rhodospirillales bacterium]|nr:substrate-binding domain-containing protein [Rhodospirillales bacterium]
MRAKPTPRRSRRFPAIGFAVLSAIAAAAAAASPAAAETLRFGGAGGAIASTQVLAAAYSRSHPDVEFVVIGGLGSTGGIRGVRTNAIDFAISGRPLKSDEMMPGLSIEPFAITPFVFAANRGTSESHATTMAQAAAMFAGTVPTWPNGTPVRPVLRPASDSEAVELRSLSPQMRDAVDAAMARPGMLTSPTAQEHAEFLQNLPGSFGAIALVQVIAEKARVDVLALDGVVPSPQTLA